MYINLTYQSRGMYINLNLILFTVQVRVEQGKEPDHMVGIFNGKMVRVACCQLLMYMPAIDRPVCAHR